MAIGLPTWTSRLLPMVCVAVLVVGLSHSPVDARPQNVDTPPADDLTEEWKEAADWIATDDVTDDLGESWRAFPRNIVKSSSHWWERKLDDKLWDADSYEGNERYDDQEEEEGSDSAENSSPIEEEGEEEEEEEETEKSEELSQGDSDETENETGENGDSSPSASSTFDNDDGTNTNDNDDDASSNSNTAVIGDGGADNVEDDRIESSFVPNDGLNSFVDQESVSSYFGDDFGKKTWTPGAVIDDVIDDDIDSTNKGVDNTVDDIRNDIREGGDPMAFGNTEDSEEDVSDEVQIIDDPVSYDTLGTEDGRPLIDDIVDEKINDNSGLQSEVKMLDDDDVDVTIDEEVPEKEVIEIEDNGDEDNHIDGLKDDVDFIIPGLDKRGAGGDDDKVEGLNGEGGDVFVSSDAVKLDFGRGEKLDGSKPSLQDWNQQDKVDKEVGTDDAEEFEDWADWDDSVFDDYDRNNDENGEGKDDKAMKVGEEEDDEDADDDVDDSSDQDYDDDDEDDDDDDDFDEDDDDESYDDDDDEDDDSAEDEDDDDDYDDDSDYSDDDDEDDESHKGDKSNIQNDVWQQPLPPQALHSSAQEAVKDEDIESLGMTLDENSPHYSKGVIYDSSHPFKKSKPSVKKDLGAQKHIHDENCLTISHDTEHSSPNSNIGLKGETAKTGTASSVGNSGQQPQQQQQSDEKMSTGLESLTSPNPAPTVMTWTDTSAPNLSPSSSLPPSPSPSSQSPSPSTPSLNPSPPPSPLSDVDNMMFGDQPMYDGDDNEDNDDDEEEEEKYVNSYPLETCRLDYECRSGRTCVDGVCKCFRASFCAGHYKPVCGSDGVEYPSHCELHRSSCINRVKIRVDRTGRCFNHGVEKKAEKKSWLMEQERLLQEDKEKLLAMKEKHNAAHIPQDQIREFPNYVYKGIQPSTTSSPEPEEAVVEQSEVSSPEEDKKAPVNSKCTWNEMAKFKEAILMYHCQKFIEPNCKLEVRTDRQYLSMLMFSYYDRNFDFFLTADELRDKERDEHLSSAIVKNCHLEDFVRFADSDSLDEKLTVSEFIQSYALPNPSKVVPSNLEVVSTLASAGDGLELKCGVKATEVIWKRYGVQLEDDKKNHKLMVFEDGALFFSKLGLHHIGNYTCYDTMDQKNAQVHRLNIQTSPIMEVSPVTQNEIAGADVEIKCHTEGVPKPVVSWRHNGKDLLNSKHVTVFSGQKHILIHNAQPKKDSGEYICRAHSQAGTMEQAVTINIHPPSSYQSLDLIPNEGSFLVFHESGITAYDPMTCLARHKVSGSFGKFKFIPDVMDFPLTLCKSNNRSCHWGDAVKVGSEFVYVSQPDQNRVLIVEAGHYWNPLQVIDTDHHPSKLQYVPHLDQVWVLCHSQSGTDSDKTIVVIRDASQQIQHRSVHTRPVGNHFDTVKDLFIAPPNDLHHEFDHGYVTHAGKSSLSKMNLEDMSYVESIDLSVYGCLPVHVAFVPLGGHVIIQCVSESDNHTLQLVMDYLTSAIVKATSIPGKPLVSPDSRHMITVDQFSGKVVVFSVSNEGQMETTYEVTVSARISDVSFIPATFHHGYDLILTSADDDDLIVMNLVTGKVEKMPGSSQSQSSQTWQTPPVHRTIVASDPMSNFVMTPSKSSLSIINFKFKHVDCELRELSRNDQKVIVHVSSPRVTS